MRAGGVNLSDSQSARHGRLRQGTDEIPGQQLPGGQHALQRPVEHARFRQGRLLQAEDVVRRRHGDAEGGRREMAEDDRLRAVRGLRPVGNLADADLQSRRYRQVLRLDRHSRSLDLPLDPRRRRQRGAARPARRNLRQGPAGDGRLLEPAGRDRQGDDRGRLLPHRRHRRDDAGRLHQDRRSQEGHDPGVGLQRLSERDRGSDREPSRRAGMRRDRRPGLRARAKPSRRLSSRRIRTSPPRTSSSSAARS